MGNSIEKSSSEHNNVEDIFEDTAFDELNCMFYKRGLFGINFDINFISKFDCIQRVLNEWMMTMQFVVPDKVYNP